jgi:hypothetical protein
MKICILVCLHFIWQLSGGDRIPGVNMFICRAFPSLLEFTSYTFSFHMILCGPFCFYKDYIAFIDGTNYCAVVQSEVMISCSVCGSLCGQCLSLYFFFFVFLFLTFCFNFWKYCFAFVWYSSIVSSWLSCFFIVLFIIIVISYQT